MVKNILTSFFLISSLFFCLSSSAQAQHWNLPADLNSSTMKISFLVETTWHNVDGAVKSVSGRVWVDSPKNPNAIRASLSIPVKSLDTDNESRDEELRDSMEEEKFHSIRVELPTITPSCEEGKMTPDTACTYLGHGSITIRDVTLPLTVSGPLKKTADGAYTIDGETVVEWSAFGVKDPSILIAKVYEKVKVTFHIVLPKRAA